MKLPPYAELLGLTVDPEDEALLIMPFGDGVLGRPGFLHGGAISGLMEVAAIVALRHALADEGGGRIKPINVTVDYMRGGREKPTHAQGVVTRLIDDNRRSRGFGVLFVTHDINPVLEVVDRVLYLAGRRFRIGTPDEVLRSEVLSELYQSPVDVIRARGRVVIVGAPDQSHAHGHDHDHAVDLP